MSVYPFQIIDKESGQIKNTRALKHRPFVKWGRSLTKDASKFIPGEGLSTAINISIKQPSENT